MDLLLPHVPAILDLVQRVIADTDTTGESLDKLAYGVIGDLADTFPNGQIKRYLLSEWVALALSSKHRYSSETKKTIRWAREVCTRMRGALIVDADGTLDVCCRW